MDQLTDNYNKFLIWFDKVDDNPWFMAIMVILANVGLQHISHDLDEKKHEILNNIYMRRFIMFSLIFCATKSFRISIASTMLYSIIIKII